MNSTILNQIAELKAIGDNITIKTADNRFVFVEIYAPVSDDEKFIAFELNDGYEEDGTYVLDNIIDTSVIDFEEWSKAEPNVIKILKYFNSL